MNQHFIPHHINATTEDFLGNENIGRYVLLPGSDGRAQAISERFNDVKVKTHTRGHNLYLGTINHQGKHIDMATIASGMGCPSMEIILHELFHLGAKRFLRVGTAGSLQPHLVKIGDIVNAQASVRDEHTTIDYVPIAMPAVSSYELTAPILLAAEKIGLAKRLHTGLVHCKSSFYAREFGAGPQGSENIDYINLLTQSGVLATEMETATLFIQSQLYNHQLKQQGKGPNYSVLAGALLGIIGIPPDQIATPAQSQETTDNLINLALETIKMLSTNEHSPFYLPQSS